MLRVCERMPSARQLVAPTKAGVQGKGLKSLDSRLRGNNGMSRVALISAIPSQALTSAQRARLEARTGACSLAPDSLFRGGDERYSASSRLGV